MKAVAEKYGDFGILQIDAHCDLREAYEGFVYSHASIMYNALREIPELKKLVQVGVRDYSLGEHRYIRRTAAGFAHILIRKSGYGSLKANHLNRSLTR
jgi:agmatinase